MTSPDPSPRPVTGATNGTAVLLADGHTVRFTPAAGYNGPAAFGWEAEGTGYAGLSRLHDVESSAAFSAILPRGGLVCRGLPTSSAPTGP